jgi:hypothetical protein
MAAVFLTLLEILAGNMVLLIILLVLSEIGKPAFLSDCAIEDVIRPPHAAVSIIF